MVERRTPEREVESSKPTSADTLLLESTGNTQEAVAPSRLD